MAAVVVAEDSVQQHDMGDTDGTTGISSIGGGAGAGAEPDFVYQGSNSVSRKIGTTRAGFQIATGSTGGPVDMTAADRQLWMAKLIATNSASLLANGAPALSIRIGSAATAYYALDIAGNDNYPIKGGWLLVAINPNIVQNQSDVTGSPALTGVDYFAIQGDFSATSKGENLAMDSIDVGAGLTLVGGGGFDDAGTFADFVADDEGTSSNRFGFFSTIDGIIFVAGGHWIGRNAAGTTVATEFTDSLFTIVYPENLAGEQDTGLAVDIGNASSIVTMTNGNFLGRGSGGNIRFNTDAISSANDTIFAVDNPEVNMRTQFPKGCTVFARSVGGTETPGITNGTRYWVGHPVAGTDTITLHTARRAALQNTGLVNLTASGGTAGEIWRLDKDQDTRPVLIVVGSSGSADFISCIFRRHGLIQAGTNTEFTGCTFIGSESLDLTQGTSGSPEQRALLTDCVITGPTILEAAWYVNTHNLADISGCAFTSGGRGHAIMTDTIGTYSFVGNSFSGYHPTEDQTVHQFDNTADVTGGATDSIILPSGHGYDTGSPVVYSRVLTSNTALSGLTEGTTYYLGEVDVDEYSLHLNEGDAINDVARINLTAGTGNETHALWPANAAIYNDSGGLVTINITDGDTPSVRNSLDSTTVINNNVTVTFTGLQENTEVTVCFAGTQTTVAEVENTGSPAEFTFSIAVGVAVDVSFISLGYEYQQIQNISFTSTTSIPITQRFDRNYRNPPGP